MVIVLCTSVCTIDTCARNVHPLFCTVGVSAPSHAPIAALSMQFVSNTSRDTNDPDQNGVYRRACAVVVTCAIEIALAIVYVFMPVHFTSLVASGELCACDVTFHCHYTFADGGIHNLLYTMFLYVAGFVVPVDRDWLCLWEMYKPSYLGQVPRLSSTRLTRSAVSSMASHHCWPYRLLKTPWLWNVVQS